MDKKDLKNDLNCNDNNVVFEMVLINKIFQFYFSNKGAGFYKTVRILGDWTKINKKGKISLKTH